MVFVISCGSDGDGRSETGHPQWRPGADGPTSAAGAAGEDQHWPASDATTTTTTTTIRRPDCDQTADGSSSGSRGAPGGSESGDQPAWTEARPARESDHGASVHTPGREQRESRGWGY